MYGADRNKQLRYIIIFIILSQTGIGGLFDTESLIVMGFPLFDYGILISILYYLLTIKNRTPNGPILTPVKWICILTLIVILSMPFRGNESLLQAFQVGRRFFILLFAYMVIDEIRREGINKMLSIVKFFSVYYSLLSIFNYVSPGIVSHFWSGIGSLDDLKGGVQRHVLKANDGLLFVHLGFIIQFCKILLNKSYRNSKNYLILLFFFISMFMMGFRAILMAVVGASLLCVLLNRKELADRGLISLSQTINTGVLVAAILIIVDIVLNNAISNTIGFASGEISGENSGTLEGRLMRSLMYQIPMFLREPFFGVGFVSLRSKMAQDIGYIRDIDYTQSLYYFDFGYGTMLVMFGIVGSVIFVLSLLKCMKGCSLWLRTGSYPACLACMIFIIALLLCNYSFGALETTLGLLPLTIIIGMASATEQSNIKYLQWK